MSSRYFSVAFDGESTAVGEAELFVPEPRLSVETAEFEDAALLDKVRSLYYGNFMLLGSEFEGLDPDNLSARFVENADLKRTREESQRERGVMFGQLVLSSRYDSEATKLVAIKPFEAARQAIHEYMVMSYLNSLAPPPHAHSSFKPLGFYVFEKPGGETGLITEYDETVISYDNLFWNPDRQPTEDETRKALGYSALGLGYLHRLGISFGDSQIKNFAKGNQGVRHIDVESADSMRNKRGVIDPIDARRKILGNLSCLLGSINRFEDLTERFMTDFVPVYTGMASQPNSKLPAEARLSAKDIELFVA